MRRFIGLDVHKAYVYGYELRDEVSEKVAEADGGGASGSGSIWSQT